VGGKKRRGSVVLGDKKEQRDPPRHRMGRKKLQMARIITKQVPVLRQYQSSKSKECHEREVLETFNVLVDHSKEPRMPSN
jgi:hypothetical protein